MTDYHPFRGFGFVAVMFVALSILWAVIIALVYVIVTAL